MKKQEKKIKVKVTGVPTSGITPLWGGDVKPIAFNPYDGGTVQFQGPAHEKGGIGIAYGGNTVEVEGGEVSSVNSVGDLTVFGALKIPGTKKTFKSAAKVIGKLEEKVGKDAAKGDELLQKFDPSQKYEALSYNSGRVKAEAARLKQQSLAEYKESLGELQESMLKLAEEKDTSPDKLWQGGKMRYGKWKRTHGLQETPGYDLNKAWQLGLAPDAAGYMPLAGPNGERLTVQPHSPLVNLAGTPSTNMFINPGLYQGQVPMARKPFGMPIMREGGKVKQLPTYDIQVSIRDTAARLGIDPVDLATVISYETAGTFDPSIQGGKGGKHLGLIQFGPEEQKVFGAAKGQAFPEQMKAVEKYLKARGVKPGMDLYNLYSTINAGSPGRLGASDSKNGGAPGTVKQKVDNQMSDHRAKAASILGTPVKPTTKAAPAVPVAGLPATVPTPAAGSVLPFYNPSTGEMIDPATSRPIDMENPSAVKGVNADAPMSFARGVSRTLSVAPPAYQSTLDPEEPVVAPMNFRERPIPSLADHNRLNPLSLLPEAMAALDRPDFVQGQSYSPELLTPYQVSFQDRLNENQATLSQAQRLMPYNPAAASALAGQKYAADSQVMGEQFRVNQGIASEIANRNTELLNQGALMNIQLQDQQYQRQAAAQANTEDRRYQAFASIANKIQQNKAFNTNVRLAESNVGFRANKDGAIENYNPDVQYNINNGVPVPTKTVTKKLQDGTEIKEETVDLLALEKIEAAKRKAQMAQRTSRLKWGGYLEKYKPQ